MNEQEATRKLEEALEEAQKDPQMRGEVLSSPLPDAFVEECKTRDGAERVVKAAYIAGMVAGVDDPIGSLKRLAAHYGMDFEVTEADAEDLGNRPSDLN